MTSHHILSFLITGLLECLTSCFIIEMIVCDLLWNIEHSLCVFKCEIIDGILNFKYVNKCQVVLFTLIGRECSINMKTDTLHNFYISAIRSHFSLVVDGRCTLFKKIKSFYCRLAG